MSEITTRNIDGILPHDGHSYDDFASAAHDDICENMRAVADEWKEKLDYLSRDLEITRAERDSALDDAKSAKAELHEIRRAAAACWIPEWDETMSSKLRDLLSAPDPKLDAEIASMVESAMAAKAREKGKG